jgi:hypothetical protein
MIRLLTGDCREVLKGLADESVHCVVTSPPYYGLRDYGTAKWEGGDDPNCDHDQRRRERDQDSKSASDTGAARDSLAGKNICRKCGARRIDNQIGLEKIPDCGLQGMWRLRRDLSEDQIKSVVQRLLASGVLDARFYDTNDKE